MTDLESNIIKTIRFPLVILVILVHTNLGVSVSSPAFHYFESFLRIFSHMAVPMFFFMSGYLFYYNIKRWSWVIYKKKIKSRIKTLIIPYFLWNLLYLLFIFFLQFKFPSLISGERKKIADYTIVELINSFWNYGGIYYGMPILYSFWYVRDLIIMCICSPLLYFIIKRLGKFYLFLLCLFFVFNPFSLKATDMDWVKAITFFSFGSWFSINKYSFILSNRIAFMMLPLWSSLIVLRIFFLNLFSLNQFLLIISVLIIPWLFSFYVKQKKQSNLSDVLTSSVMFVYGFHLFCIMVFNKFWTYILPINGFTASVAFICIPFITSFVCVALFCISKKIMPRFTSVLIGCR